MDKIVMSSMAFFGYHGVFPEENKLGQRYVVDAELVLSLSSAGKNDDLAKTINYAEAYEEIKNIVEGPPFKLIEALAEKLAASLIERYPALSEVAIRVTKPNPPFAIYFSGVTVEIRRRRPVEAYIALGSNLGDRMDYLERGIRILDQHPHVSVLRRSAVYETEPVGYADQGPFLNMAVAIETDLAAEELLAFMLETELVLGRVREIRNGPRTLDLDLVLYGKTVMATSTLIIPHPRMGERAFVLIPLAEIAADDAVPGIDSLAERLKHLEGRDGVRKWIG